MADFAERRKYKRWNNPLCKVMLSNDKKSWEGCEVCDLSAGGLKFIGNRHFSIGQFIYVDLTVFSGCSEFRMVLTAQIVHGVDLEYGVKFLDISKQHIIQIDEIVKAAIEKSQENLNHYHKFEDGIYTFCFNPVRRRCINVKRHL